MSDNKLILKNSLILYARLIVISIIGIITSRFILKALGESDYGLYNVVGGIVFFLALLNNVMVSASYRFIAFEIGTKDEASVNKIFNISLVIHLILAVIIILFAELFGLYYINNYLNVNPGKINDAIFVFQFSVFSTVFSVISVPFQGLIIAKEKFITTAFVEIIRSVLGLIVVGLTIFFMGNKLRLYSGLIAFISIIPPIIYFVYCKKYFKNFCSWNFQSNLNKYKEMLSYSGWTLFGATAGALEVQGSAILINLFFGTFINAGLGIANQVNNMVKTFSQSLNQAVIPQVTKSFSSGNVDRTMQLVIFSSKYTFYLMLLPSLPILLETDYILRIWLETVPQYTSILIKILILNALIYSMSAGIPSAIQATGNIKYFQIVLSVISLTGLPIAYIFFKNQYPPQTLFIVYTFIQVAILIVMQLIVKKVINFNVKEFFINAYFKMVLVALSTAPLFIIHNIFDESALRFFSITVFSVAWLLFVIYLVGINSIERVVVRKFIVNKFKSK